MQYNVKHILIVTFFLNQFNFCFGQSPLQDTLIRYQRVDDLIDSIHFSARVLKSGMVKSIKVSLKDGYYSKDNDSLYIMKHEFYNQDGFVTERFENSLDNKSHKYFIELDSNNQMLFSYELIGENKVINGRNVFINGLLSENIRKFTTGTNEKITFRYDSLGQLIERNEYCFDETSICSTKKLKYDLKNRLIEIISSTKSDGVYSVIKFNYDSLSRLVSQIELDKNKIEAIHTYHYSVNKGIRKVEVIHPDDKRVYCFGDKEWNIYQYDDEKIEEEITIAFTDDYRVSKVETNWPLRKKSIKKRQLFCGFTPPKYQKVEVKYSDKGLPVSKKEFAHKNKHYSEVFYEYNDKGLLIKKTEYDNGKIDDIWFYEYTYW